MLILSKFKGWIMHKSRSNKLDHFYGLCGDECAVLDVGVSNNEHNKQVNLFLNQFRFDSEYYTGLAVEPLKKISRKHPNKKFIEYPGGIFPFNNKKFEWVFSNAVIEHVGNQEAQLLFINEMLRVGKHVFFTTPNKYFPVESHTNALFVHWNSEYFYKWCRKHRPSWNKENLLLLSYDDLQNLMKKSNAKEYLIQRNKFFGMSMTFTVVCFE
ncbi:MAG: class I SAM-dependent methyltransferase [Gammaproteobacteria bacterium]|nr:class I SAM-dependent methyltransferase [Gammaproteobacteria bacterium]